MSNEREDTTDGLDPAGGDEVLWRLLGRARRPEVSPYFARRVLREVTLFEEGKHNARARGWRRLFPSFVIRHSSFVIRTAPAVCVAVFWLSVVLTTNTQRSGELPAKAFTMAAPSGRQVADADEVAPQDVEVIADLDNLISREESRLWTDDTARF